MSVQRRARHGGADTTAALAMFAAFVCLFPCACVLPDVPSCSDRAASPSPSGRTRRRPGPRPVELSAEQIRAKFHMTQPDAARAFGISVRTLSKCCRRYGVFERWPWRSSLSRSTPARSGSCSDRSARETCKKRRSQPSGEAATVNKTIHTIHWSRDEVESAVLVKDDDVRTVLEHLSAQYYQQHGKQPTVQDIQVWDLCLRSMRVDCTERKMLGDGQYHQVVKLSGMLLTKHGKALRKARKASDERSRAKVDGSVARLALREARPRKLKCAAGDCDGAPRYTDPREVLVSGGRAARVCRKHMGSHHVNVRACIRCEKPECVKLALYGSPTDRVKARCGGHQLETDVRLQPRPTCEGTDGAGAACQRRPVYGERGRRARHCSLHKRKGEEDLVHKHCESAACAKQASFGDAWERSPRFCTRHKLSGHIRARGNGYTHRRSRQIRPSAEKSEAGSPAGSRASGGRAAAPARAKSGRALDASLVLQIYGSRPQGAGGRYGRLSELSAAYGVSRKTIWDIWSRRSWAKTTRGLWSPAETLAFLRTSRQPPQRRLTGSCAARALQPAEAVDGGSAVVAAHDGAQDLMHPPGLAGDFTAAHEAAADGWGEGQVPLSIPAQAAVNGDGCHELASDGVAAMFQPRDAVEASARSCPLALAPSAPDALPPQPLCFEREEAAAGQGRAGEGAQEAIFQGLVPGAPPALSLEAVVDGGQSDLRCRHSKSLVLCHLAS